MPTESGAKGNGPVGNGSRGLRGIATASAVAVAGLWTACLVAAPGPHESWANGPSELERASGAIEFYEAKYAANDRHPTFGHKLIDFYARRFGGEAELTDLRRAEEIARQMEARARHAAERSRVRARLSSLLLARHDFGAALASAAAAVEDDPTDGALGTLFDAALAAGEDSLAGAALARMEPGSVAWLIRASRVRLSEGRLMDALALMGRAYRMLHDSPAPRQTVAWAATMLAEIEAERSGPDAAARWHRRALEIAPGYRGALEGLADLAYARGRWEEAEGLYRRILAEAHPDLYLRLAEVLRGRARERDSSLLEQATELERRFRAVAGRPGLEPLYARELALFYAREPATHDRALETARRDLERRSAAEGWEVMAWVHLERGELREALGASSRAVVGGDPSPTARYTRARILEALGRAEEAELLYASALAAPTSLAHHALRDARARGLLDR